MTGTMGGPARGLQASAQGGDTGTGDKWSRLARTVSDPISPFMTKARARRDAVVSGTTQIDDWLDRGPR